MKARLSVLQAGPHVSVQDAGRAGLLRFGVPGSGPMDRTAFRIANRALGNPPDAPGIEVSRGGLALECVEGHVSFAVAGGGFAVDLGPKRGGAWVVATLHPGERLTIRAGPWGSWTYLVFAGDLQARRWLGSAATHALSGLGGGKLTAGQVLDIDAAEVRTHREGRIPCPVSARPRKLLRVVLGPQDRFFDAGAIKAFLGTPFALSDAYDRMGVRLSGPDLRPAARLDMPSEAILRGSVQVAGDGVATVLLADHGTTGGYPKIATILSDDLDGFVQLRPHDKVAFQAVDPALAVQLARSRRLAQARYLARFGGPG